MAIDLEAMPEADRRKLAEARPDLVRQYLSTDGWKPLPAVTVLAVNPKSAKPRGEPNKLETDFATHIRGVEFAYEAITFRLAGRCTYTPDYVIQVNGGACFVEIKIDHPNPSIRTRYEASLAKLKIAADRYRVMRWYLARRDKLGAWNLYPVTAAGISRKSEVVPWIV